MKLKLCLSVFAVLSLTACSIIPPDSKVEPKEFDNTKSYALNVANQTALTLPYYYGRTYSSPLRDFTEEERSEAAEAFEKQSNAGSLLGLAGISVLTGNFTGAAMTAGASGLTALTTSKHIASKQTWIIAVDKSKFNTKMDAQKFILNSIDKAVNSELSQYGDVKMNSLFKHYPTLKTYMVKINGEWVNTGIHIQDQDYDKDFLQEMKTNINGKEIDSYTYGFNAEISNVLTTLVTPPMPQIMSYTDKNVTFDEVVEGVSKRLPQGFYLYYPPFPTLKDVKKSYINTQNPLPTIYTQGKKYEFIKP